MRQAHIGLHTSIFQADVWIRTLPGAARASVVSRKWMDKPRSIYSATTVISSGLEIGNPWTIRFHSTFGFWTTPILAGAAGLALSS